MTDTFLLYGCTGFVGSEIAEHAVQRGLEPIVAGRDPDRVPALASGWGLDYRVFRLDRSPEMDQAVAEVGAVLHCAGPFIHTFKPMLEACLRGGTHYLDLTGEIPVYQALTDHDDEAKERGIMLLPGVGFDVVATDCLALHLKKRLPSATHLRLAFHSQGPAGAPPGTVNTAIEMARYGIRMRRKGRIVSSGFGLKSRKVDFGEGPEEATLLSWGDVFMAYHSTGIPNIEDYVVLPTGLRRPMALMNLLRPLFEVKPLREFLKWWLTGGSTPEERSQTTTNVWGEVEDGRARRAAARLHGPEAGVVWTKRAALATIKKVLAGEAPSGFQTPAGAYGPELVLECEGVRREDLD